jgi:hypothetical protein
MGNRAHATNVIEGVTTKSQYALGIEVPALLHFLSLHCRLRVENKIIRLDTFSE